jgi:hypothetical protein
LASIRSDDKIDQDAYANGQQQHDAADESQQKGMEGNNSHGMFL